MKKAVNALLIGFLNGIAILTPVIITVVIIRFIVIKLNSMVLNPLLDILSPLSFAGYEVFIAKSIILLLAIFFVAMVGWGAKVWAIRQTFLWGERIFVRVPLMGRIYNSVKQITSSLMNQSKVVFKQVVLVEFPSKGVYSIGFLTGVDKEEISQKLGREVVKVLIPTAPNPTTGFLIAVARESLIDLDMSIEDAVKMIISGGVVTPQSRNDVKK
ncbi:MAG: DUF502 domain-containing protein [Candidatus Omnitrophica bacterium]|nr:DUF502 domain-containing protein [Candidatus Omnitrophota bacterium]MDD4013130.1 DUF502 domain-containing protein [Candidatus Omnitrophota bacterium]